MIDIDKIKLSEKQKNIIKVLSVIIEKPEAQTSDIRKETGLSVSTISRVINILRQKDLIELTGKEKIKKGRFPQIMRFNFGYGNIVHIDIKPNGVFGCISELSGEIKKEEGIEFSENDLTKEFLLSSIKKVFDRLKNNKKDVLAVGISLPGIVDEKRRLVRRIPDIIAFDNVDVYSLIEDLLKVPVIINNIPGIAAIGERIVKYPKCENLVYLNIMQTIGIGAGIIINGKLIKGKDSIAGEVGDFYFDRKNFSSNTGNSIGRMEQFAGLNALYSRVKELVSSGGAKALTSILESDCAQKIDLKAIEKGIEGGDIDLEKIYMETVQAWVILIIDIILLINPDKIVIGGAVSSKNVMTKNVINKMLSDELFVHQEVEFSKTGEKAVFFGGLHILKRYVYSEQIAQEAIEI